MNARFKLHLPLCRRACLLATALALCINTAYAADPVTRIVIGFPAGGFIDNLARMVGEAAKPALGGNVVVDAKTGAGGILAINDVKKAAPDGKTLLITPAAPITIYPHTYRALSYAPAKDLIPVAMVAQFEMGVIVAKSHPALTLSDLARWYRENPARTGFGTPGAGTGPHFAAYEIMKRLGVDTVFAHYRGDPPQVLDVAGGSLPAGIVVTSVAARNIDKLKVLATTGTARSTEFPDVPTLREAGVDAVISEWVGVFAPAGTPPAVVEKLNAAINAALAKPDSLERMAAMGVTPLSVKPADFARRIGEDTQRWAGVVKASGFQAD